MKSQKTPSFVVIGILTVITILFWIGFSVYRIFSKPESIETSKEILEPISPSLDTQTLDKVAQRIFFNEGEVPQNLILVPSPTPSASPSAEIQNLPSENEQAATGSATEQSATSSGETAP